MKKRIMISKTPYNMKYKLTHPWIPIDHYWRELKYFFQRGLYGYSESDVWSLDAYLCTWLPSAIMELRDQSHGCPQDLEMEEWKEILRRIAKGFEAKNQLIESVDHSKKEEELLEEQFQEGMKWFVKYFTHLWD